MWTEEKKKKIKDHGSILHQSAICWKDTEKQPFFKFSFEFSLSVNIGLPVWMCPDAFRVIEIKQNVPPISRRCIHSAAAAGMEPPGGAVTTERKRGNGDLTCRFV